MKPILIYLIFKYIYCKRDRIHGILTVCNFREENNCSRDSLSASKGVNLDLVIGLRLRVSTIYNGVPAHCVNVRKRHRRAGEQIGAGRWLIFRDL